MGEVDFLAKLPNSEIEVLIEEWVHSKRDRDLLKRRFIDGIKYEALAEEFDLSVRRTKAIVYNARNQLSAHVS